MKINIIWLLILSVLFLSGCGIVYQSRRNNLIQTTTPEVTISTDRNDYDKGEILNIIVKNGLDKSILYSSSGDRFWDIEYFENGIWKKFGYEGREGFQLANENIGDTCYIVLYERMPPTELKSQSSISSQWNQKICFLGTGNPAEPRIVRYIESGKYRLVFNYGFEISENDPFRLSEIKTIYSNTFTIK